MGFLAFFMLPHWRIRFRRQLDLQAKISLVLIAVILPTFLLVTLAENSFTRPILEEEMKQLGVSAGKNLALEIARDRLLSRSNASQVIEDRVQEALYSQPHITRVDVYTRAQAGGLIHLVASNFEEEAGPIPESYWVDSTTTSYQRDANGLGQWGILVPIRPKDPHSSKKILGVIHLIVSTQVVEGIAGALWKTTASAALLSVVLLFLLLGYFLRKTIANDRKLRKVESKNLQLAEQLHETERKLMNSEKLAVMGQLTASFAHEIGTPLNALGGHVQLLQEEAGETERLKIIQGQLQKIASIVKNFLQNTAQPPSQRQLVDINRIVEQTLRVLNPRFESLNVEIKRNLEHELGPIRWVPIELEQILLNLLNNALDSLEGKRQRPLNRSSFSPSIEIRTRQGSTRGERWAELSVRDNGEGIRKEDLDQVLKPFFTTKAPGEGTGLGLTICREIAKKNGGSLHIQSRFGAWAEVTLHIPYPSPGER